MNDEAVLFARQDSNYKAMAGTDVFDIDRDARTFAGGSPPSVQDVGKTSAVRQGARRREGPGTVRCKDGP